MQQEVVYGTVLQALRSQGTLDAIHLATALMWREQMDQALVMATHDVVLGTAA